MTHPVHRMIRSRRRSLALQITEEGHLLVRAPERMSDRLIERFLTEKQDWIRRKVDEALSRGRTALPALSAQEERSLKDRARDAFIERACYHADRMGVRFTKIRLSSARTRWGSCGPSGSLSFNWKLIRAPMEVLDYVVVHELAHLKERNHSARFWAVVAEYFPGHREAKRWLRSHRL